MSDMSDNHDHGQGQRQDLESAGQGHDQGPDQGQEQGLSAAGKGGLLDASLKSPMAVPSRRQMLALGAVTASMVVSVKPAFANTAVSIMNCEIPVPDPARAGQYIAADGSLVPAGTKGAFPPFPKPFKGEDVKKAMAGRSLPGTTYDQSQAYVNYIRKLQMGQSGFTCYASIQMPRS